MDHAAQLASTLDDLRRGDVGEARQQGVYPVCGGRHLSSGKVVKVVVSSEAVCGGRHLSK